VSAIEELAEFVIALRIQDVPETAIDHLRLHLFDTLGAAIAGGTTAEGGAIRSFAEGIGASGDVPALGLSLRTSASVAALATCAATRCTEVDDIHLESCTTPGSVIVPTVLALVAQERRLDAETFMAALLVGYEVLTRFGKAARGPTILYRGVWPTYLASTVATAAAASRALSLSREEAAHALATALTLTTGAIGRARGLAARWLTLGLAVQNGILVALAARRGFRSDLRLLDGGWSSVTGIAVKTETLLGCLGRALEIERVSIKPYCAAKQVTGAIYGFVGLLDEKKIEPAMIERVVVSVPTPYTKIINQPALPTDRLGTITSAQYQLAVALYHREELRDVRRTVIHDELEFRQFMARVIVEADEGLDRYYPAAWPARIEVWTRSGRLRREVQHTKGDPSNPVTWDEAVEKVGRVTGGIVDQTSVDRLAGACRGLGATARLADLLTTLPP
jgi:2-methylcitrate dehydratase PrpD